MCDGEDFDGAAETAKASPDPAASLAAAAALVSVGRIADAAPLFAAAGQHGTGAAVAARAGCVAEARQVAMGGTEADKARCAGILAAAGHARDAAALFQAAGQHVRAHDL